MIRSMTGYGRGEASVGPTRWTVEAKSVNHRFLDVRSRLPSELFGADIEVQRVIQARFNRGRFEVTVTRETDQEERSVVHRGRFEQYLSALRELKGDFGIEAPIGVDTILGLPGVLEETGRGESEGARDAMQEALSAALKGVEEMRAREGEAIALDLRTRIETILSISGDIEKRLPALNEQIRERMRTRIEELAQGIAVDGQRLEQEVVFLIERADVTEEIVRLGIHGREFLAFLEQDKPVGRKMDFLIQEINREVNTLGAKIGDAEVARWVVEMKSELEKVREQVQNVE